MSRMENIVIFNMSSRENIVIFNMSSRENMVIFNMSSRENMVLTKLHWCYRDYGTIHEYLFICYTWDMPGLNTVLQGVFIAHQHGTNCNP